MVVCQDSRGLNLKNKVALFEALRSDPENHDKKKTKVVVDANAADSSGKDEEDNKGESEKAFTGVAMPTDFEALTKAMESDVNPHRVLIDHLD